MFTQNSGYPLFASFFGLLGGVFNILNGLSASLNKPAIAVSPVAIGICFILAGVLLFALLPCLLTGPSQSFWEFLTAAIGVFFYGLANCGINFPGMIPIANWSLFLSGFTCMWCILTTLYGFVGMRIPGGKPIKKS